MGSGSQRSWLGVVGTSMKRAAADEPRGDLFVGPVRDRGADAIGPGAAIDGARRGERRAAELLGVEAEGMLLRRILALRASAPATASVANSLPKPD